ncbi:PAS domain-containing sensor histidine kinase [Clostridium beijerinckii]|uniref:PAS domain-containing sensor histidine kinase n=1 Tax=Clostridium beijerinckii TaxID=1520 RepID=UPI00098BDE7D|nr:PAS domain-containing sensor histidine kinase [Clostridium beijerinckii]MBA8934332.1 PAS domain S-box-containing protein [Clostridium beijerinckii]NRU38521.1 PAS domain S-box-containing protein [Clostridium beijerinckii]NSA98200.1 PAS domain S-box-containing protein [Clostridium beijerinckii]OOM61709.1 sensor protein kinase WalK [Clostridium beijerinckii]OOM68107.1 sensor protein kinase WalK [Clostridium beijerinckii]
MKNDIDRHNDKLKKMVCFIKITIIVFTSIIIHMNLPKYWSSLYIHENTQFDICMSVFSSLLIGINFIICLIITCEVSRKEILLKNSWLRDNIIFTFIISIPLYLSKAYQSEYKYLFLLLIIYSIIQYGSKRGIITSLFSSGIILAADLLYAPLENGVNVYFQKDLIMCGVFIFVAWILGYYVDIEAENNKKKDETLNTLSNEKKEMESLLLNNKICYDMLFENSLNSIIVHRNGEIIYANASATKLLGLNGESFYKHYLSEFNQDIKKKYTNISDNKFVKITSEENILNCNGEFIPVINTSSFFTYKGKPSVLTFLRDITSEKKVESLQEDIEKNLKLLNESREFNNLIMNFFTNMSHELKTPVNVIYSAVQTVNIYFGNYSLENIEKCKSYFKTMKQNCLRLIRIINNFLDVTKLNSDSGFIKIKKRNGNIVDIIEEITQSVASYVNDKDITLIFDTNVEEKIMGFDHDMMERIMLNLISNALKYSHANGSIYVDFIDKETTVIIKVKDEGDGIPEDKLNFIFERFGQVDNTLSRKCEGTGVGLYLVKSFVEMHGGKISVVSVEGQGSEFIIELPVELIKNEEEKDKILFKTNIEKIQIEFSDIYSLQS